VSIPARRSAKVKTLVQDLTIGLCLLPPLVRHETVLEGAVWFAAALTVVTGLQYLLDGRRVAASTPGNRGGTTGHADLHSPTGSV
jgi:CDP-diacylglycerol--glycerol-3-phosphate 3-phosphatidyltransferase